MSKASENVIHTAGVGIQFIIDGGTVEALRDINLDIRRNEFICIVGASGCGKSTLLRIIGGLETRNIGKVLASGRPVTGPSTDRGIVFQEPRLFPWMTVGRNIAYGLPDKMPAKEKENIVEQHLKLVGLENFKDAFPEQLSGGMQQRASIARALVNRPEVLLMDEPFGALDAFTRINMQQEVLKIWEKEKTTVVLVTHDIDEAVYLSDRIVLMSKRPGTIKKIVTNELPRPRRRSSEEYANIRNQIYAEFFSEFNTEEIEYYI
ncbi:MAG: ABC transporter ATP-binding protein [Ethanoligenens sp.]